MTGCAIMTGWPCMTGCEHAPPPAGNEKHIHTHTHNARRSSHLALLKRLLLRVNRGALLRGRNRQRTESREGREARQTKGDRRKKKERNTRHAHTRTHAHTRHARHARHARTYRRRPCHVQTRINRLDGTTRCQPAFCVCFFFFVAQTPHQTHAGLRSSPTLASRLLASR